MIRLRLGKDQHTQLPASDDVIALAQLAGERTVRRLVDRSVPRWADGALVAGVAFSERAADLLAVRADGAMRRGLEGGTFEELGFQGCKIYLPAPEGEAEIFNAVRLMSPADAKAWRIEFMPGCWQWTSNNEDGPDLTQTVMTRRGGCLVAVAIRVDGVTRRYGPPFLEWGASDPKGYFAAQNSEGYFSAIRLALRYSWRVRIRRSGAPGLDFQCDSRGALDAFRLRESPPGRDRREALLHWVCSHRRCGGEVDVAEHLRGAHRFTWGDFEFEILPSDFDREKEVARKSAPGKRRRAP